MTEGEARLRFEPVLEHVSCHPVFEKKENATRDKWVSLYIRSITTI